MIVLEPQLRECGQVLEAFDLRDRVAAQVEPFQTEAGRQSRHLRDAIVLQRELLEAGAVLQLLDDGDVVVAEGQAAHVDQPIESLHASYSAVLQHQLLYGSEPGGITPAGRSVGAKESAGAGLNHHFRQCTPAHDGALAHQRMAERGAAVRCTRMILRCDAALVKKLQFGQTAQQEPVVRLVLADGVAEQAQFA